VGNKPKIETYYGIFILYRLHFMGLREFSTKKGFIIYACVRHLAYC